VKNPAGTDEMRTLQTISQVSGNMRLNSHQMVGSYVKHPSFFCEKHPGLNANRWAVKKKGFFLWLMPEGGESWMAK